MKRHCSMDENCFEIHCLRTCITSQSCMCVYSQHCMNVHEKFNLATWYSNYTRGRVNQKRSTQQRSLCRKLRWLPFIFVTCIHTRFLWHFLLLFMLKNNFKCLQAEFWKNKNKKLESTREWGDVTTALQLHIRVET